MMITRLQSVIRDEHGSRFRRRARFANVLLAAGCLWAAPGPMAWAQKPAVIRASAAQAVPIEPAPLESLPPAKAQALLGLPDLENMALASSPAVAQASALVASARGNWLQVGLPPNPSVGYNGQQIGSGGLAEQHGVMVSQDIIRGGKLRLNRAVAEQEIARAEQQLAVQQRRVLTDVRIGFYHVLVAQRQIDATENLLHIAKQVSTTVDSLLKAQEGTRAEVLQARLELENAQILARNARHRHDAAWRALTAVIGDPCLPPQALAGDAFSLPQDYGFCAVLARIQSSSPEIGVAFTDIGRARAALDRARAEPVPNVSVQGLMNVVDNGVGGRPDAGIAVSMPIPVFNRNQGAIQKAQSDIAAAERNLQKLELALQVRLAPVFERYANARNQVDRYRAAIMPVAKESLELTRKNFAAGEANFLTLLTVQRTFSQTNLNYLEAIRELQVAEAEIEGLLLRDSLLTNP